MSEEYDRIIDQWEPERRARIRERLARIDAIIESRRQARSEWEELFAAAIAENLAAALRNEAMLREAQSPTKNELTERASSSKRPRRRPKA